MELNAILNRIRPGSSRFGRPPTVVDIASHGVLASATAEAGVAASCAFQALTPGALTPGIDGSNIHLRADVIAAIHSAMAQISSALSAVTVIVPDSTTRVFVLEFDTLPHNTDEVTAILRMRLRKIVPFNVEHASVSHQILPQPGTKFKVLAAVIPTAILAEYEGAVEAAGYKPGAVLPAGLAALAALNSHEPALMASLDDTSLTTSITHSNDLLLYRTHLLSKVPAEREAELRRDIAVAVAYFEDKLLSRPTCVFFAGTGTVEEFASAIHQPEMTVVDLAPKARAADISSVTNDGTALVADALAGAR